MVEGVRQTCTVLAVPKQRTFQATTHNLIYPGCHSGIDRTILKMRLCNCGIRDISEITGHSRDKVQKVLKISQHHVIPEKNHYDSLEVDKLWTFAGNKKCKVWLTSLITVTIAG